MAERYAHQAWAEAQMTALLDLGFDAADAQRALDTILQNLPAGADPATWIPPVQALIVDTDDAIDDARAAWYASPDVPPAFKRLLDAAAEEG